MLRRALVAFGRAPFSGGHVVLNQEWRFKRAERGRLGQHPAHDPAVGPDSLARDWIAQIRASRAELIHLLADALGRGGPHRETAAGLGSADDRPAHPAGLGQLSRLDPDQLDEAVAQPDQPVEGPERGVPAGPGRLQPELGFDCGGSGLRVLARNQDVVNRVGHGSSLAAWPWNLPGGVDGRYDGDVDNQVGPSLRIERTGPSGTVARLSLARPERHNAFDATLIAELRAAFIGLAAE